MKEKLTEIHKKIPIPELAVILLWITALCIYIAPSSFIKSVDFFMANPILILLNTIPVAAILITVFFVTYNTFLSSAITNLVFGLLNYANLLKIDGRDDPLVPGDFGLLREALKATGDYRLDMHWDIVALIAASTGALIIVGILLGQSKKRKVYVRIVGAVLTVCAFIGAYFGLYRDAKLYQSFPVSSAYNITSVFNELGFNYCFVYNFELYSVDKPEGYSARQVEKWAEEYTVEKTDKTTPNVIMIMCEAFSELNGEDVFTYSQEDNPLFDYYAVKNGDNCIASGKIVVPNFGAGTANTEFDVITGMQTNLISRTSNSAMRSFHRDIPTVASVFSDAGYATSFLHPGNSWFYNRDSALSHMGFDERIFIEDMENKSIMDSVFLQNMISLIDGYAEKGERLFSYATSIQNHQSYTYGKYGYELPKVQVSVPLSEAAEEYLSVYSYGIACSSQMLSGLTEYLNSLSEPYVLVFFGDHMPNLGADYLSYRELGMNTIGDGSEAGLIESCSAPYIIWGNDAYLEGKDTDELKNSLDLPSGGYISASFLGEVTLELCGMERADSYFSFLSELRRELPVIKNNVISDMSGEIMPLSGNELCELVDKLHCWQYYRMS